MCFSPVLLSRAKLAARKGLHASFPISSSTIFPSHFFGRPDPETDGSDQAPLFPPQSRDNLPNPQQSYSELGAAFVVGNFVSTQAADSPIGPYCAPLLSDKKSCFPI